uniref:Secreted protein n=1 Tax=Setaria viridis TaxID=4556 RepID=A0A4U6SYH2_SETVI|nr:hypothetical protein SEVIR_9G270550v2 [Setaria viridis]
MFVLVCICLSLRRRCRSRWSDRGGERVWRPVPRAGVRSRAGAERLVPRAGASGRQLPEGFEDGKSNLFPFGHIYPSF